MLSKEDIAQVMEFVSRRWTEIAANPDSKVMGTLPSSFWMNSVGGKAGTGRWITTLMYTESDEDAEAFKAVLQRWQAKGMQNQDAPDLIQIQNRDNNV